VSEILQDSTIQLVAGAAVPCDRGPLGVRVMQHGKDYFTDKCPFTTLDQLADARAAVATTGRKYAVLLTASACTTRVRFLRGNSCRPVPLGASFQCSDSGPHRLNAPSRPAWFFEFAEYGGILCDIGSHQVEQFLYYSGATDGTVLHSKVANYAHPDIPELQDYGDAHAGGRQRCHTVFPCRTGLPPTA
jgi:predicted dehydrogenase